ncbi:MAG: hypothetical protein AAGK97_07505, partial [Bacteroidota bacterium]
LLANKDQWEDARNLFKKAAEGNDKEYAQHAKFEYIRTSFKLKSFGDQAKSYLEELKTTNNNYTKIAQKLDEKLDAPLRRMFVK